MQVIDREMQYFHCPDGTCVGRVQARKEKARKGALVANLQNKRVSASSTTASDFDAAASPSFCPAAEEDDCEWRQTLRRLPLDEPK